MKPKIIFLDTSVLNGQQYNFSSIALTTFIGECNKSDLQLILPDPTEREIKRQIKERSQEALNALEIAKRKAPFLAKWKNFPSISSAEISNWEVTRVASNEWLSFLQQFKVIRLKYEGLNIQEIMNWYDAALPPFDIGKKRKEFPDAFAISILNEYAEKNQKYIAVVSLDADFKSACERFPRLMYFNALPRLTEFLISEETNLEIFRNSLEEDIDILADAVDIASREISFYHENGELEIYDLDIHGCSIRDFSIVAIGSHECTITFNANLNCDIEFHWQTWWDSDDEGPERMKGWVTDERIISGSAKLIFDDKTSGLLSVSYVDIDDKEIEIRQEPFNF